MWEEIFILYVKVKEEGGAEDYEDSIGC